MKRFIVAAALLLWITLFINAQEKLKGDVFSVLEQEVIMSDAHDVRYTLYDSKGRLLVEYRNDRVWGAKRDWGKKIFVYKYNGNSNKISSFKLYSLKENGPSIVDPKSIEAFMLKDIDQKFFESPKLFNFSDEVEDEVYILEDNIPEKSKPKIDYVHLDYIFNYNDGILQSITVHSGDDLIAQYLFMDADGYNICIKTKGNGELFEKIPILANPKWEVFDKVVSLLNVDSAWGKKTWDKNCLLENYYEWFGDVLFDYCQKLLASQRHSVIIYDGYDNLGNWTSCKDGRIRKIVYVNEFGQSGEDFISEESIKKIEQERIERAEKLRREKEERIRKEQEMHLREEQERQWAETHPVPSYAGPGVITEEVSSQWKCVTWSDPRIQKLCKKADFILYVGIPFTVTRDGQVLRYKTYDQKQKRFPTVLGWHCGPSSLIKKLDVELSDSLYNALWEIVRKTKWNCGDLAGRFFIQVCWKSPKFKMKINDKSEWTYQSSSVFREGPNDVFLTRESIITEYAEVQKALAYNNGAIAKSIFTRLQNEDYNVKATTSSIDPHAQYFSESVADEIDEEKIRKEMDSWIAKQAVRDNSAIKKSNESRVDDEAIPIGLVDKQPSFMGGNANKFSHWVGQHLVYPEIAKENGVQGRVTLQFTIQADGRLTNVKVVRGIDPSLDKEAVRCVSTSPRWKPGTNQGKPVSVTLTFPVLFQLR